MSNKLEVKSSDGWRINADKRRTNALIDTTWAQIRALYDHIPVAVHMVNIVRSKGVIVGKKADGSPIYRDPYFMTNEETLKIMEAYREELDLEALDSAQINSED
jgi:hypothetical protein